MKVTKEALVRAVQAAQMKRRTEEERRVQKADREIGAYIRNLQERIRRKGGLR